MSHTDFADPQIAELRRQLTGRRGKRYWRSLAELADTPQFQQYLRQEFPAHADQWDPAGPGSRRTFLKLMGASLALAGIGGCTREPQEKIVPYVRQPEEVVPGKPLMFATAATLGGYATGLLVESHMGRPTKVEGNPDHPASLGASDIFAQAATLTLYDPDRSQTVKHDDQISTWDALLTASKPRLDRLRERAGRGLSILTQTVTSPTLAAQINSLRDAMPEARWHQYEPTNADNLRAGAMLAFGEDVHAIYDFSKAQTVLSLDSDFLASGPGHLMYARQFMSRRNVAASPNEPHSMNRCYAVDSTPTLTGAKADHHLSLRMAAIEALARAVASQLGIEVDRSEPLPDEIPEQWVQAVVDDLQNYQPSADGASLVLAGPWQPPVVHALVHLINDRLGNVGRTVTYHEPVVASSVDQVQSLGDLVNDMRSGRVDSLYILGGNPVFDAPADFDFAAALDSVGFSVHLGTYENETSARCTWYVPETHFLESWSDCRAFDGTATIAQPLIAPLYEGKSVHEVLAVLLDKPGASAYETVRAFWRDWRTSQDDDVNSASRESDQSESSRSPSDVSAGVAPAENNSDDDFERWWRTVVHDGIVPGTQVPSRDVPVRDGALDSIRDAGSAVTGGDFDVVFRPDATIWDGRFANNGWLQELPKPLTKLTWDNAVLISPQMAEEYRLVSGDVVQFDDAGRRLRAAVWVLPGHPPRSVTVHYGYGRTRCGQVGDGTGFNVFAIRTSTQPWFGSGARLEATGEKYPLATTQHHFLTEDRHPVLHGTLEALRADPEHPGFMDTGHGHGEPVSMYPPHDYDGYKWGMSINLTSCVGCAACVIACQAENNIPIVGKEEVQRGRVMHWIRVDRYYEGDLDQPDSHFQPVNCMHCELAPCEPVCPVAATTHSSEGLNEMTYNRCVGTRYCANNCPYKVRRFNFFEFTRPVRESPSLQLLQNPDVTVRSRGVMEKCTYCVQRISHARITAEKENRTIRDGELQTACQQVCPTGAIVFGDMNDKSSRIAALKDDVLDYGLLEDQNTRPRTTYLASLRNPNPMLAGDSGDDTH